MTTNNDEIRKVQMVVLKTEVSGGEFTFDMQSRSHTARTVRFAIEQIDAKLLYEAIGKFLSK